MADEGGASAVETSGGQGVQVGTGNIQVNTWTGKVSLDPESLDILSPHAAIDRLRGMPHDDMVYLFAKASPGYVTDVLKALMEADEAVAVAVLADINSRKAGELIAPLLEDFKWLEPLPTAATAINRRAAAMKWTQPDPPEHLHRLADSGSATTGYFRAYKQGKIYWTSRGGACALGGDIAEYYASHEGAWWLGYPAAGEAETPVSPSDTKGTVQRFERGVIYSSARGTHAVRSAIFAKYARLGHTGSWLGFPVAEVEVVGTGGAIIQRFEGGAICVSKEKMYAVRSPLLDRVPSELLPVSDEDASPDSPYSTDGKSQEFESRSGDRVTVYSSRHGSYDVGGRILDYFLSQGATSSWLGFPVASERPSRYIGDQAPASSAPPAARAAGQSFEGGVIYELPEAEPIAVPKAAFEFVARRADAASRLGFPVTEEAAIGSGADRIQFFENGNLTLRSGKREIWLSLQESGDSGSRWVAPGYLEERELGHGSTSRVVAAVQVGSRERVAIKYLATSLFADPDFLAAFRQEAALRREVRDVPQIVRLRDYLEETGHGAAIVMDLVDGVSLHQMITRHGSTTPVSALVVLRDSLLGLGAMHQRGMVHRDYKPENVLVDARGQSKLTDLGEAVAIGSQAAASGTPLYMAPEVWEGHPASPAGDVYAATAVFFECLTGRTPFAGSLKELQQQHASAPVPMDGVDMHLRGLITRGMAKDPAQRPANAMEFLAEVTATADAVYQSGWSSRVRQLSRRVASLRPTGHQATTRVTQL